MIIGNGLKVNSLPMTMMSCNALYFNKTDKPFGLCAFDKTSSNPEGFGMKAINKPRLGGSISGYQDFSFSNIATLTSGINMEVVNEIEIETSGNADVVANIGSVNEIEFENTLELSLGANLSGTNTLSIQNTASPSAIVNIQSVNTIAIQNTATMSATASLSTGVDDTVLTAKSIWGYSDRTLTGAGGLSAEQQNQLDAIEEMAGLIPVLL